MVGIVVDRTYQVADIVRHLEFTVGSGTLGVDNTLGDPLAVEMSQKINQMKVLQKERAILADPLRGFGVHDRTAIGGCVYWPFFISEGTRRLVVGNHAEYSVQI